MFEQIKNILQSAIAGRLKIDCNRESIFLHCIQQQRQPFIVEISLSPPGRDESSYASLFRPTAMLLDQFRVVAVISAKCRVMR